MIYKYTFLDGDLVRKQGAFPTGGSACCIAFHCVCLGDGHAFSIRLLFRSALA